MTEKYQNVSPYSKTPQRNYQVQYLDLYENRPVPADDTDDLISIPVKYDQRPDLLAAELYGTPELWWIFAVRNPDSIIDPIYDLTSGKEIYVPTRSRVYQTILGL